VSGRLEYLLDTNVLSETRRKKADAGVISFLQAAEASSLYISVLTLGELRKCVAKKMREDQEMAKRLAGWVEGLELSFADRILDLDAATARLWGDWSGERSRPVVDTLLAATAARHGLTLVTRNIRDVEGIPVKVLDPWKPIEAGKQPK
jgi:predicted nucleic acid-binding protein